MIKPSIAELLRTSGHTEFTLPLVMRAMYALYGNVGANLDERNWSTILQSSNPLQAAEDALRAMYQDNAYLLRNTQHLAQSGYVAAQAEITYRQMAGRLDYTYNPAWSDGTAYDYLGDLTYEQLVSLVPAPPPPPPLPTISVTSSATGFSVALNVAGTVKLSVSGDLGNFAAGSTLLTEQTSVKEGYLTLSSNGNTSTATSQYLVLGTRGDNTIDTSAAGNRVDYLFGGAGNDSIRGGGGADVLLGGDGNDQFIYTTVNELFAGNALVDVIDGGTGTNALVLGDTVARTGMEITAAMSWAGMTSVSELRVASGSLDTRFSIVLNDDAYETGLRTVSLANHSTSTTPTNIVNVSAETGSSNGYILVGSNFSDIITGGAGNDTIQGGGGADVINGSVGIDTYKYTAASESIVNNTASTATGFDSVTVTNSDRFDFGANITARAVLTQVLASNPVDGNGATLLTYLNNAYQALNPPVARVVVLFRTADGNQYLVADLDASKTLTTDDNIIQIVGAVTGLSLAGGDIVVSV